MKDERWKIKDEGPKGPLRGMRMDEGPCSIAVGSDVKVRGGESLTL